MIMKCPLRKEKYQWKHTNLIDLKRTEKNLTSVGSLTSLFVPSRLDDILIGAPLFMEREFESNPREIGQVYLYMQVSAFVFGDPQVLAGTEVFGRFGSAVAHLGDLNQDGYNGELRQCVKIDSVSLLNITVAWRKRWTFWSSCSVVFGTVIIIGVW